MAIPAGLVRFVLRGSLGSGEVFETGWWAQADGSDQATTQAAAAALATKFSTTTFDNLRRLLYTDSAWTEARAYSYPSGGPSATYIGSAPITNGTGTGVVGLPEQLSIVATTLTGILGRRNRGRMYLPANGAAFSNHLLQTPSAANVATAVATLIGPRTDATHGPVVLSQIAGSARPVTQVRVDSRADIQRRRANKQTGATSSVVNITTS